MRILLFTTIISLLFCASAHARNLRIVVFGDSLTAGVSLQPQESFAVKLKDKLSQIGFEKFVVIDKSTPDNVSVKAIYQLNSVLDENPDIVVLGYGLSDIIHGVNPAVTYQNTATIVGYLKQKGIYTVLLGLRIKNYSHDYEVQLPYYYDKIASHYEVAYFPNALDGIYGESKFTAADGFSPNAQGVDILVEGVYRLVDYGLRWKITVLHQQGQY